LRRELRLLRMDHETLLSSTDVRSELMALNDKYEEELAYVKGIVVQKDQEIERLRKEIDENRIKKEEKIAEENVNDTPLVVKGTVTEKRVTKVT
jgi:hypothetical protein